jgi:hypothetical protein
LDWSAVENFKRGAILAANPQDLDRIPGITEEERQFIDWEGTRRWKQPMMMWVSSPSSGHTPLFILMVDLSVSSRYFIAILSSMAAIVQGMDEVRYNISANKKNHYSYTIN